MEAGSTAGMSSSSMRSASAADNASSQTTSALRARPPQLALPWTNSGRAVPRSKSGPRPSWKTASSRSSRGPSAQCRSSIATTAGWSHDELFQEGDPRLAKLITCGERMKVGGRFQPERHAENRPLAEPVADGVRRIAFEQAQMLANDLAQRHVRDPPAVRETAPTRRSGSGDLEPSQDQSSLSNVVFPIPASPMMVTSRGWASSTTRRVRPLQRVELLPAADEGVM